MAPANALILDFDSSVLPLAGASSLSLGHRQEAVRFGCTSRTLERLDSEIGFQSSPLLRLDVATKTPAIESKPVIFLGSGDYHHISHLLIKRYAHTQAAMQVVVFDNHPDNMRYPFGIHCGSWVNQVSRLPFVRCVHVLGITSTDVEIAHAWENHLRPLRSGKVRYWCVGRNLAWMRYLGITQSQSFASISALLNAFERYLQTHADPVYLSIDKDVLSPDEVHTNWDQGVMRLAELGRAIGLLKSRVIASDVTGEVSTYRYRSRFKRLLSGLDKQPAISDTELALWQREHQVVNQQLLGWLA